MFEKSLQPPRDHTQHCSQQLRIRLMPSKNKIAHVEVRPSPVCAAESEQVAHISQRMSTNDPMKDAPFHWDMQSGSLLFLNLKSGAHCHLWPTSWHVAGERRQVQQRTSLRPAATCFQPNAPYFRHAREWKDSICMTWQTWGAWTIFAGWAWKNELPIFTFLTLGHLRCGSNEFPKGAQGWKSDAAWAKKRSTTNVPSFSSHQSTT